MRDSCLRIRDVREVQNGRLETDISLPRAEKKVWLNSLNRERNKRVSAERKNISGYENQMCLTTTRNSVFLNAFVELIRNYLSMRLPSFPACLPRKALLRFVPPSCISSAFILPVSNPYLIGRSDSLFVSSTRYTRQMKKYIFSKSERVRTIRTRGDNVAGKHEETGKRAMWPPEGSSSITLAFNRLFTAKNAFRA